MPVYGSIRMWWVASMESRAVIEFLSLGVQRPALEHLEVEVTRATMGMSRGPSSP